MSSKTIAGMGAKLTPDTPDQPFGRIMAKIAEKMCLERGWTIHTNGDLGGSAFFEDGLPSGIATSTHGGQLKRFLPEHGYNGHRVGIINLDEGLGIKARALLVQSNAYPVPPRFITLEGEARDALTDEETRMSLLHTRLAFQLLGEHLDQPVTMLICWTPDGVIDHASMNVTSTGTTGIAIALAQYMKIPVFNLQNPDHLRRICVFIGESVPSQIG